MFAAYGLDVLDTRAVTPRRLWALANRLPPAARLPGEEWTAEAYLLAALVDSVGELIYVTARAAGASNVPRPRPIPRPRRDPARPATARTAPRRPVQAPARSWGEAIAEIAAMPGVEVVVEGGA